MSDRAALDSKLGSLAREFAPALPDDPKLAHDANLHEAGLTSMATVKLMLAIEAAYNVAIPDAELTPENFRSIATIEALLERLPAA
ncbi:MAG: phosphopantetheine-binding protein [Roseiarcus sp.]|jgi:acyl carrier protein